MSSCDDAMLHSTTFCWSTMRTLIMAKYNDEKIHERIKHVDGTFRRCNLKPMSMCATRRSSPRTVGEPVSRAYRMTLEVQTTLLSTFSPELISTILKALREQHTESTQLNAVEDPVQKNHNWIRTKSWDVNQDYGMMSKEDICQMQIKHLTARMFFRAFMHCALTLVRIPLHLRSTFVDRTHLLDRAIEKSPVRLHPSSRSLPPAYKGHHIHFLLERKDVRRCGATNCASCCANISAHVHLSDVGGQSGNDARMVCSTGSEPNVRLDKSETFFLSIADGEDLNGDWRSCMFLKLHGETGCAIYRAAQMQTVFQEVPVRQQGLPYNTQHVMQDVKDYWMNQSCSALQLENAAQEHQRVAHEEVQIARVVQSSEIGFRIQGHWERCRSELSVSNRTDDCPKLLPSQPTRHPMLSDTLIHDDTAKIKRRDTHQEEVLSQLRIELQYNHHHEGQSEEFQQSEAELGHVFGTIKCTRRAVKISMWRDKNCECQYCTRCCSCRCEVKRRNCKHSCWISNRRMLGPLILRIKFEVHRNLWT